MACSWPGSLGSRNAFTFSMQPGGWELAWLTCNNQNICWNLSLVMSVDKIWHLVNLCCAPVILDRREIDQPHVENDGEKTFHLTHGTGMETVARLEGFNGVPGIPVQVMLHLHINYYSIYIWTVVYMYNQKGNKHAKHHGLVTNAWNPGTSDITCTVHVYTLYSYKGKHASVVWCAIVGIHHLCDMHVRFIPSWSTMSSRRWRKKVTGLLSGWSASMVPMDSWKGSSGGGQWHSPRCIEDTCSTSRLSRSTSMWLIGVEPWVGGASVVDPRACGASGVEAAILACVAVWLITLSSRKL